MNCKTLGAMLALSLAAAPACATSYHFMSFDAPAWGAATVIDGINNHGQAVGYYVTGLQSGPTYHAFTLQSDGSGFASIDRPGAAQTGAGGINDLGVVAGVSVDASFATTGFLLDGSGYHDITLPVGFGALGSEAVGVDTAGDVVGHYVALMPGTFQPTNHGFVGLNGVYVNLEGRETAASCRKPISASCWKNWPSGSPISRIRSRAKKLSNAYTSPTSFAAEI